jgi:glycosyltransferase involved in cell wall biosynthesis
MTRIHLIYPHGSSISAPDSIGREVGKRLEERYEVLYYDWDEQRTLLPARNDVLLGHAHPKSNTIFRLSARQQGWKRVIMMSPYCHGNVIQAAFLDRVIADCDLYLAITGNYWFQSIKQAWFAHWYPKMIHVDLAVDRHDFPILKNRFAPPGERKFIYIGHSTYHKNLPYLNTIARTVPECEFGWAGQSKLKYPALKRLGFQNFSTTEGKQIISAYDFLITVGKADANPTTILEAMAWGLIPICTPTSGYSDYPGIINIPVDNVAEAVKVLQHLQQLSEAELVALQQENWRILETHFNWDRVAEQVTAAIESDASPPLGKVGILQTLIIRLGESHISQLARRGLERIRHVLARMQG